MAMTATKNGHVNGNGKANGDGRGAYRRTRPMPPQAPVREEVVPPPARPEVSLPDYLEPEGRLLAPLPKEDVVAASRFTREEVAALVGLYISIQKTRVGASNRVSAHDRRVDTLADSGMARRLKGDLEFLEAQTRRGLLAYARSQPLGRWCLANCGVGPVSAAALLAHIDLTACACAQYRGIPRKDRPAHPCPGIVTAGAVWRFAGMDPDVKWERGQVRPWNARLKVICWNLGKCFVRNHKRPECFYGHLYAARKRQEEERNAAGLFAEQARARLSDARQGGWRITEEMRACWEAGKLQPAGLELRAIRYVMKIFLSHYHHVGRTLLTGSAPEAWVIAHGGHANFIPPPHWPLEGEEAPAVANGKAKGRRKTVKA